MNSLSRRLDRGSMFSAGMWKMGVLVTFCAVLAAFGAAAQLEQEVAESVRASAPNLKLRDGLSEFVAAGSTDLSDQTEVAVTVYNNDRALVRDRRSVKLLPGEAELRFMDVAERIMPETVGLKSLSAPGRLRILEQNYEYDLMSPEKLMEKYVGHEVRLVSKHSDYAFGEVEATLMSMNNGPVYRIGKDIYLGHPGSVVLPEIPKELIAKPSLIWLLLNDATDHDLEVTYMTTGLSWKADYVLSMNQEETQLDVEGWVTLNNQSGATYGDARLKLVAGAVNIVQPRRGRGMGGAPPPMMEMKSMAYMDAAREETFGEYHLYTIPRRTTIKQNQAKQVSLLRAAGVEVKKVYEYRGNVNFYSQQHGDFAPEHIAVYLAFENEEENQLGMPLPAGVMRVYQEDSEGMLQFAGEDRIKHTPKDEEVRLRLGEAFDIVAERKQTDYKRISTRTHEAAFEIEVRNHKEEDVAVDVIEPMPGDWKIIEASQDHVKKDAHTAVFPVRVKADGETKLTYRVRVTY